MQNIRLATPSDVPRIVEINIQARRAAFQGVIPDSYLFDDSDIDVRIKRISANLTGYFVYDDGATKGFIAVNPCPDADAADFFELRTLYVDPKHQGCGIGKKLIHHFENTAAESGFGKVCLYVLEENTKARAFYAHHGYLSDGAQKSAINYEGTHIRYTKIL